VWRIVIDTNVFVSALLSQRGAAFRIMTRIDKGLFHFCLSVPLVLEYEDAAKRILDKTRLTEADLNDILDYVCKVGDRRMVYYLWRPFLRDPGDDMVLELAVAAECDFIITYNLKDFAGIEAFGVQALPPQEFLRRIG
jgi:putative PIN family toxin of toxin-antitoxin system